MSYVFWRRLLTAGVSMSALGLSTCEPTALVGRECSAHACENNPHDPFCARCKLALECEADSMPIARAGIDMYVMFDASTSLLFAWQETKRGFESFLMQPDSAGLGVGLQFFGERCDIAAYATPAVPIAALPENAPALMQAFPWAPTQETPTTPALQGALSYARDWQNAHPTRSVVVSLVTDGFPEECESTTENLTLAASEGLRQQPPIKTFLVGINTVGNIFSFVTEVSNAVGVPTMTVPPQSADGLAQAFAAVRDTAAACLYALPQQTDLATSEGSARLGHTAPDGSVTSVPVVADELHCDPVHGGVYPLPGLPSQLRSCPASCADLDAPGQLDLYTSCGRDSAELAGSEAKN